MLRIETNGREVALALDDAARVLVKKATVYALNDTATSVLEMIQGRMRSRFDRPTRFTQNAFMKWGAKTSDQTPTSEVRNGRAWGIGTTRRWKSPAADAT